MKELTRNTKETFEISNNGYSNGEFDPLETQPIDAQEWADHVASKIDHDKEDGEVIAKGFVCEVSYYDEETGETDIRYEARYEKVD